MLKYNKKGGEFMKVTIGVSNHHVHVTSEDLKTLFGEGVELNAIKPLNQPGQFAAEEKVTVKTENGELTGLRILGPCRNYTQVEISQTDARNLKISAPVRCSGDLEGAAEVEIVGPCGSVRGNFAIIADRHIHVTRSDRERLGLVGVEEVSVLVSTSKGGVFDHVKVREAEASYYEMHIDTDDANGFLIDNGMEGEILVDKK